MKRLIKMLVLLLLLSALTGCTRKTNRLSEAYSVLSMKPDDFSHVVFIDQQLQEQKAVEKSKDIRSFLRILKKAEQLPDHSPELSALTGTYVMKFFTEDAEAPLLTISYAENGRDACLFIGGNAYSVKPLGLEKLWSKLKYESVPVRADSASPDLRILETTESDLSERYGENTLLGYIRQLDAKSAVLTPVERIRDETAADGWVLHPGADSITLDLSPECEFWILQDHWYLSCRMDMIDLSAYIASTPYAMLWTFYLSDEKVAAIAETYSP